MFLATQGQITNKLKSKLEVVPGFDDLLCEIVDLCCSLYEQKAFILPAEKHMLLKVCDQILLQNIRMHQTSSLPTSNISLRALSENCNWGAIVDFGGDLMQDFGLPTSDALYLNSNPAQSAIWYYQLGGQYEIIIINATTPKCLGRCFLYLLHSKNMFEMQQSHFCVFVVLWLDHFYVSCLYFELHWENVSMNEAIKCMCFLHPNWKMFECRMAFLIHSIFAVCH